MAAAAHVTVTGHTIDELVIAAEEHFTKLLRACTHDTAGTDRYRRYAVTGFDATYREHDGTWQATVTAQLSGPGIPE